jgi:alkylation response protein AidB-like acyl-CoA dehydrogenase
MIDLLPDAEQQQIVDAIGSYLADKLPVARHRRNSPGASIPPAVWQGMAQLGWFGLGLPESHGGAGYGTAEEALAFRELGRNLAPLQVLGSVMGAKIAHRAGDRTLLDRIAGGKAQVAVAYPNGDDDDALLVLTGSGADYVAGWSDSGCFIAGLGTARRNQVPDEHPVDPTVELMRVNVTRDAKLHRLPGPELHLTGLLLSSAMFVGMAEAARDMAVAYAKQRQQFGEPIGAFQSIKHILADTALRAEAALSGTMMAALLAGDGVAAAEPNILAARIVAANAALLNAAANIQVHGGIGFTAECDAHLYVKRANILDQLTGGQRMHQSKLALAPAA